MTIPLFPNNPPLVGRDRELRLLRDTLAATLAGHGGLVLIGGEAGIGKTTLAEDLCREAVKQGALVLVGRCYDLTETPPYGPWVELFGRYQPDGDPAPPEAFARHGMVGEVTSQAMLFQQVQDFLMTLARQRPLVLLLDDLHWADPASLDLLRVLARSVAALPMLLVVTYRADELTRHHPLYTLLPLLERESGAIRLDLRRLSADAVRAMVAARYPLSTADSDRLVTYLDTRAEGNAFFTSQLLRALEEGAAIRQEGDGWAVGDLDRMRMPAALRQVIDGRVTRLGDEAQRLLAVAAVIGQETPFAFWAAVTESDEERLLDVVEQATAARIVEATEDGMRVRFVHALIRETLYAGILPMRRRVQHRRIGDALATLPDADPDTVAYHFRQAGDPRAVEWLIRAGERAQQAYARLTAADRFEEALALMEMGGADASERGWLLLRLALLRRYSDFRQALGYLEAAGRLATEAGDILLGACIRFNEGLVLCYLEEMRRGMTEMEEAVTALDALFPLDESALRRLERMGMATDPDNHRGTLALWLATTGALQRARTLSEEVGARILVVPTTARLDGAFAADAFRALGAVYAMLGQPVAARQAYRRNKDAYRAIGDHFQILMTVRQELHFVALPYQTDDLAEQQRLVNETAEASTKVSSTTSANLAGLAHLPLLVLNGHWQEAHRLLTTIRTNSDVIWAKIFIAGLLGLLARQQGGTDLAWTLVREEFPAGPATLPGAKR
ncbi:MAG: ATP-binding protein [Thermomicrobiales bacterium]